MWRIYRLPGSRQFWHIDMGHGSVPYNCLGFDCLCASKSVDIGGENVPRAWIEIDSRICNLHIINGIAVFSPKVEETKVEATNV